MFSNNILLTSGMQTKTRNEYNPKAISVLEYSYTEDCNYNHRQKMEDGIKFMISYI